MTKAEKRKLKKKDRGIVDFIKIVKHFFKNLNQWIEEDSVNLLSETNGESSPV